MQSWGFKVKKSHFEILQTNLKWLTVAMPILETNETLEKDQRGTRERQNGQDQKTLNATSPAPFVLLCPTAKLSRQSTVIEL